jgi:hypothetical protein
MSVIDARYFQTYVLAGRSTTSYLALDFLVGAYHPSYKRLVPTYNTTRFHNTSSERLVPTYNTISFHNLPPTGR